MNYRLNDLVNTPIGQGRFQGVMNQAAEAQEAVALVRLNVNAETEPHRKDSNCLTPRAATCGLWTFKESELS